jgi:RNA polymerase sigma-70 factor (ECF subfamily)
MSRFKTEKSNEPDASDESLLRRIASQDEQAMELFYQRHGSAVFQFAEKTLRNPADASEICNEVMMEVWRKANTYSGGSKVKTWLLSIAHHKAVDTVRRKSRHDGNDPLDEEFVVSQQCSLEDARAGAEDKVRIKRCMSELKQGHQQVVHLTFFEGLGYPEIANILEIPAGTVKTRMMHAKNQLMNCLSRIVGRGAVT